MIGTTLELAQLLVDVGVARIELAPDPVNPERLRHRPRTLPPDLATRLRLAKPAALAVLRGEGIPDEADPENEGG